MKFAYYGELLLDAVLKSGIEIDESSQFALVERGIEIPAKKIAIVFDANNIEALNHLLGIITDSDHQISPDFIPCKDEERIILIKVETIEYFMATGNEVFCYIKSGKRYDVKRKLYELERILFEKGFFRINKSTLVNIQEVKDISPWFGSKLLLRLKNGTDELEVSRKYVADFKEYLGV